MNQADWDKLRTTVPAQQMGPNRPVRGSNPVPRGTGVIPLPWMIAQFAGLSGEMRAAVPKRRVVNPRNHELKRSFLTSCLLRQGCLRCVIHELFKLGATALGN